MFVQSKGLSQPQISCCLGSRTDQSSDCLAAYLDAVPKMSERGPPHCFSQVLLQLLNQTGGQRGGLLNMCCVQLLRPCTISMLWPKSGVCWVPMCQLPLTLLWVRVAMLMGVVKLKRQRTTSESIGHVLSSMASLLLSG